MRKEMLIDAAIAAGFDHIDDVLINKLQIFSIMINPDKGSNTYMRKVPRNSYGETNYNPMLSMRNQMDDFIAGAV